jgi:hypothetical protein
LYPSFYFEKMADDEDRAAAAEDNGMADDSAPLDAGDVQELIEMEEGGSVTTRAETEGERKREDMLCSLSSALSG